MSAKEKNWKKNGNSICMSGDGGDGWELRVCASFDRVARDGLIEKVKFEIKPDY